MHNFALVAYDPSALGAGASVVRAAELLPGRLQKLLPDMCSFLKSNNLCALDILCVIPNSFYL